MTTRTLLVALVAALAAGCGGSTKTVTENARQVPPPANASTTPAPSHTAFVAELDRLCAHGNRRADVLFAGAFDKAAASGDYGRAAAAVSHALPFLETWARRLAQMSVPNADLDAFGRYRQAFNRQAAIARRLVAALRSHDDAGLGDLAGALDAARRQRLNAALDLGADSCGH